VLSILPRKSGRSKAYWWYNEVMSKGSDKEIVASPELAAIAEAQGVKPPDFDRILSEEPIMPDDETADMMIEAIYRWREEKSDRSLP